MQIRGMKTVNRLVLRGRNSRIHQNTVEEGDEGGLLALTQTTRGLTLQDRSEGKRAGRKRNGMRIRKEF